MSQQGQHSNLVDLVDFNPDKRMQKVIQIYLYAKPLLLCQNNEREFRESTLEAFLRRNHIPFNFERRSAQYKYHVKKYVPQLRNERQSYDVVGMGKLVLDPERKMYHGLIGGSKLYDLGTNQKHEQLVANTFRSIGWKIQYLY
jgi:hypothetical protein